MKGIYSRYLLTHLHIILLIFQEDFSFMTQQYFIAYKPFQVITQFSPSDNKKTLKDVFKVAPDVYPVGRLDYDSEGLLILTNDNFFKHRLTHPSFQHEKEYYVQVEGAISSDAILQLQSGVDISVDGKTYRTRPAKVSLLINEPSLPQRIPPIRFRKAIPTSWISIAIHEGKNRQVRKMTAATGYPTLRLVRYRIGKMTIDGLEAGDIREMSKAEAYKRTGLPFS